MTNQWAVQAGYRVVGRLYENQFGLGLDVVVEGRHDWQDVGTVKGQAAALALAAKALRVPAYTLTVVAEN